MSLLSRWLGPDLSGSLGDGRGQVLFASRSISVSDLLEVEAQLKIAFPRVELARASSSSDGPPTPLAEPLEKASDHVLQGIVVQAWAAGHFPAFHLSVGRDTQADARLALVHDRVDGVMDAASAEMLLAAERSVKIVAHAGRRVLSVRHWRDLLGLGIVLMYTFVVGLFALSTWPHVVWLIVAALALVPTAVLTFQRLERLATRLGDGRANRVIVRSLTREEWRRQRYENRRDWKARGVGVFVGVVGTVLTSLVVQVLKR